MSKCAKRRIGSVILCMLGSLSAGAQSEAAGDTPTTRESTSALSDALVNRAQNEVTRIKALVDQGTLPKSLLEQAEAKLADAQDEAILSETLYGTVRLQDMTAEQAAAMISAAQRRVDRQSAIVADRQKLLDGGIISKSEFASFQNELDSRQRVLELAQSRAKLLEQLRAMAETEQRLERAARMPSNVLIRYDGNGLFNLADLPAISSEFEKRFHRALPISAFGQTLVHQSMGLDHRNRVDVALNPDQPEGVWLRQLLERLHVPYLAFRSAVAGAATAPHIHIGPGSTRLKLASR
jgi:multidrug resistance efflux pump